MDRSTLIRTGVAGAVRAEHAVDLAGLHLERHVENGADRPERLRDADGIDGQGFVHGPDRTRPNLNLR